MNKPVKVRRTGVYASEECPTPVYRKGICGFEEGGMHTVMARIYRHFFAGGTFDQLREGDVVILILNPSVKKGTIKRKSYGSLYERTVVYINTITGYMEVRTPKHWGNLDVSEVEDRLDAMDAERLV